MASKEIFEFDEEDGVYGEGFIFQCRRVVDWLTSYTVLSSWFIVLSSQAIAIQVFCWVAAQRLAPSRGHKLREPLPIADFPLTTSQLSEWVFNRRLGLIIGFVRNKKVKVYNAAKAHKPGLKKNQQANINAQPPEKAIILGAHTNEHIPGYKRRYR